MAPVSPFSSTSESTTPDFDLAPKMSVAVVGAGWNGCYTAIALARLGHSVSLYDSASDIMEGSGGKFGARLHAGPHYPRSEATRRACRSYLEKFEAEFGAAIVECEPALYGLAALPDSMGLEPRVADELFAKVCEECEACERLEPEAWGACGLQGLWRLREPGLLLGVGGPLRQIFREKMEALRDFLEPRLGEEVRQLQSDDVGVLVNGREFDACVDCSGHAFLASGKVQGRKVVHQAAIMCCYRERQPGKPPVSFTVMDGFYPCVMPRHKQQPAAETCQEYLLYHAQFSLLGSYATRQEAQARLDSVTEAYVQEEVRPRMEASISQFLPAFLQEQEYVGFEVGTVAKLKTAEEFRAGLVWQEGRLLHVFPGKVSNCVQAGEEVAAALAALEASRCGSPCGSLGASSEEEFEKQELTACDMSSKLWLGK